VFCFSILRSCLLRDSLADIVFEYRARPLRLIALHRFGLATNFVINAGRYPTILAQNSR
jgi:hypothetical protein